MRWQMIQTVLGKEMLEMIRDRRAIISMIVVPLLLFPLLIVGAITLIPRIAQGGNDRLHAEAIPVRVSSSVSLDGLEAEIGQALKQADLTWTSAGPDRDLKAEVDSQRSLIAIEVLPFAEAGVPEDVLGEVAVAPRMIVYFNTAAPASVAASNEVEDILIGLRDRHVRAELAGAGLQESLLDPFVVRRDNAANQRQTAGAVWGSILGYMLILMMFSGGMYPIMDMTAGEKERKTLEAYLASPAKRSEIVMGKILAGIAAILMTGFLMMASLVVSFRLASLLGTGEDASTQRMREVMGTIPLDGESVGLLMATLLPLALLAAAVMFAISLGARSFKEAQTYLTPMLFVVIVPGLLGGLPGFSTSPILSLIPILNSSQVIRAILIGDPPMLNFALTLVSNLIYAAAAIFVATRLAHREQVLFRT